MSEPEQPAAATTESAGEGAAAGGGFSGFVKKNRGNLRKRAADDDDDGGQGSAVARSSKPKKESVLGGSTRTDKEFKAFTFDSDKQRQQQSDNGATASLQSETEFDRDGRALREKVLKQAAELGDDKVEKDDGMYHGQLGYIDYRKGFRREHNVGAEKSSGTHGPLRAPTNVRFTFVMDYKPDICKDYKETGYCGFGDGCKFMHDRGDYKHGWQLDREWEEKEKVRKEREAKLLKGELEEEPEEEEEDDLPFACLICRLPWTEAKDPVVTKCKHYFCEQCALKHNAKVKTCFTCNQATAGVFNTAKDVLRRLKEQQDGTYDERKKARAEGKKAGKASEAARVGAAGWLLG